MDKSRAAGPEIYPLSTSVQPPTKSRMKKAPTLRDSDWDPYKSRITELYTSKIALKDVIAIIKAETGFVAEHVIVLGDIKTVQSANQSKRVRQYKSRVSKWNLDRNIKPEEMKAIIRKRQKRKLVETEKSDLVFQVRGVIVDTAKIDRWMQTHGAPKSTLYSSSPAASRCTGSHSLSLLHTYIRRVHRLPSSAAPILKQALHPRATTSIFNRHISISYLLS
jgi:hypothetical protein